MAGRNRFWQNDRRERLVRDNRGYCYYERRVPLGHHGGASASASSGSSYVYVPTVSPSPSPRRSHRRHRHRHRRRRHRSLATSDTSSSVSSAPFCRRGRHPAGRYGPIPWREYPTFQGGGGGAGGDAAYPVGVGPFGGQIPMSGPGSDDGSEDVPPILGRMFPPGSRGTLTLALAEGAGPNRELHLLRRHRFRKFSRNTLRRRLSRLRRLSDTADETPSTPRPPVEG